MKRFFRWLRELLMERELPQPLLIRVVHSEILVKLEQPKPVRRAVFGFAIGLPTNKKPKNMPLDITITNEQQIPVTLSPKTDSGKPAPLDGSPTWEVISGNSTIQVSEDGKTAMLVSADDPGDTQILVKADADIGEGVEEISDTIKLTVRGATAKNLGLAQGTAEPKPTA